MSHDIETAVADSLGELRLGRHKIEPVPPGTLCRNCATPLMGAWCHKCGQAAEDFHRSTWRLVAEAIEGLLHFDGRVWHTLPDLFFRPGRLTRAYLDGHRAPQIPPFRLFLIVLLSVIVAGSLIGGDSAGNAKIIKVDSHGKVISEQTQRLDQLSADERAGIKGELDQAATELVGHRIHAPFEWFKSRLDRVLDDPERFTLLLERWSERFAFLTLPLLAALLSIAFVSDRRLYLYDHLVFSLHSLSALGLISAAALLLAGVTDGWSGFLLLASPVHLFAHLRGVYETTVIGALARTVFLLMGLALGGAFIALGWVLVGLNGMMQ